MSPTPKTRAVVLQRDEFTCVRCGKAIDYPFGDYSIHHRRARGMGGSKRPETDLPANLVLLCGSGTTGCHHAVESDRLRATADGFLVSQWADPELIPVRTYRGKVLLSNDGMLVLTPDLAAVAAQDSEGEA